MAAKKVVVGISRALKFFERAGYMTVKEGSVTNPRAFIFGQTGGLLVHNFMSEWFASNVILQDGISIVQPSLYERSKKQKGFHLRTSLSKACQEFYEDSVLLNESKLPMGLVASGRCLDMDNKATSILNVDSPEEFTECLLQYYVPAGLEAETFHQFEVDKLTWWKTLSNSKEFTTVRSEDGKTSSIRYSSSHGSGVVETLRVCGPCTSLLYKPYMVEARVIVDTAALVFLYDAYSESQTKLGSQVAINLHQRLAPYKLLLSIQATSEDTSTMASPDLNKDPSGLSIDNGRSTVEELGVIAGYITQELKKEEILIKSSTGNSKVTSLQQLGIPYQVVLSKETLENGVVLFHNLSESTKESVHLSELRDKIVRYVNY